MMNMTFVLVTDDGQEHHGSSTSLEELRNQFRIKMRAPNTKHVSVWRTYVPIMHYEREDDQVPTEESNLQIPA